MAQSPAVLVFLLALLSMHPLLTSAADTGSCFLRDGTPAKLNPAWLPCNPNAKASACCSPGDFCMSNGLCLDAVGDQNFSVQGCSVPEWPQNGCPEICNSTARISILLPILIYYAPLEASGNGNTIVHLCSGSDSGNSVKYCCGADCSCSDSNLPSIPIATEIFHPPQAAASASASASVPSAPQPVQSSARDNDDNTKGLAIGLGVGIPLGLALVGGVIFVGLQLRKWAVTTAQQRPMDNKEGEKRDEHHRWPRPEELGSGGQAEESWKYMFSHTP
ncbi:hypothetical protein PG999_007785 [Apiospora kogelbergensis]|uniref:Uncharacterized protein n=1 Tax=Apiospora kogelbergensis TaxID=1337665 RepID=A0AAW0QNQ3_9PEZI